jgi:hypothetical protein
MMVETDRSPRAARDSNPAWRACCLTVPSVGLSSSIRAEFSPQLPIFRPSTGKIRSQSGTSLSLHLGTRVGSSLLHFGHETPATIDSQTQDHLQQDQISSLSVKTDYGREELDR